MGLSRGKTLAEDIAGMAGFGRHKQKSYGPFYSSEAVPGYFGPVSPWAGVVSDPGMRLASAAHRIADAAMTAVRVVVGVRLAGWPATNFARGITHAPGRIFVPASRLHSCNAAIISLAIWTADVRPHFAGGVWRACLRWGQGESRRNERMVAGEIGRLLPPGFAAETEVVGGHV